MTRTREKFVKKADCIEIGKSQAQPCFRLGPQLRVHSEAILDPKVWPIRNDPKTITKPRGGFWTSTYDADGGSGWVRWCVAFRYNEPLDLYWIVLSPSTSAKVAVIDSAADLMELTDRYPMVVGRRSGLDFERLADDYDALHLTHEGYLRTRSTRRGPRLTGWDCESTLWFRWMFTEWHDVQRSFLNAGRFDDLWLTLSGWSADDYRCHRMPEDKASKKVYESMLREMAGGGHE